jgi:hypothetical protein
MLRREAAGYHRFQQLAIGRRGGRTASTGPRRTEGVEAHPQGDVSHAEIIVCRDPSGARRDIGWGDVRDYLCRRRQRGFCWQSFRGHAARQRPPPALRDRRSPRGALAATARRPPAPATSPPGPPSKPATANRLAAASTRRGSGCGRPGLGETSVCDCRRGRQGYACLPGQVHQPVAVDPRRRGTIRGQCLLDCV